MLSVLDVLSIGESNPSATMTLSQVLGNPSQASLQNLLSSVYNPSVFGADIANQTITGAEAGSFAKFYYNNFVVPTQNDADLRSYFNGKFAASLMMLLHAKFAFGQGTYGQYGKAIQSQQIRPVTVYASTGAAVQNWYQSSVTAGWNEKFFDIDLTTSSTTADLNLRENVEMIIFGFADFAASPKLFEVQFNENGSTPLGVKSHSLIFTPASQRLILLDQVYGIPKNTKYTIDCNFAAAGESQPVPLGIQFVTSVYSTQE